MHVLQGTLVVMLEGQGVLGLHQIAIVDSGVTHIVPQCCNQYGKYFQM